MAENKSCASCANLVPYEFVIDGVNIKKYGCLYHDMTCERAELDTSKCGCADGDGWVSRNGRE